MALKSANLAQSLAIGLSQEIIDMKHYACRDLLSLWSKPQNLWNRPCGRLRPPLQRDFLLGGRGRPPGLTLTFSTPLYYGHQTQPSVLNPPPTYINTIPTAIDTQPSQLVSKDFTSDTPHTISPKPVSTSAALPRHPNRCVRSVKSSPGKNADI